ncbi:MAG: hypothetical protein QME81_02850 [bacterium]|nr:hypothetical protein [bacterium]
MEFIEEYKNDTFWEELIHRLAERDLIRQLGGIKNVAKLSFEECVKKIVVLEEKYAAEFEARGLDGLSIIGNKEIETKETPPSFWEIWKGKGRS